MKPSFYSRRGFKADILVTGATGLIGGEIAIELMKRNARVWCVIRADSFTEAASRLQARFAHSREECDWSRLIAIPGDIQKANLGIDLHSLEHLHSGRSTVIHCAAETSFAPQNLCRTVNINGTQNVVELCEWLQARLFHVSSAAACLAPEGQIIQEDSPYAGFTNDYIESKRAAERIVLEASIESHVLRPSIVLSHGVLGPRFARSILWVLPIIRQLGILPLNGDEPIDAVSVRFVAQAVAEMLERPLKYSTYHLSAGPEDSVSWRDLFTDLFSKGHHYGAVQFDAGLDWDEFGSRNRRISRLKACLNQYLPFMRAGIVYSRSRLEACLDGEMPRCPKVTEYCADLLELFDEREALIEAATP